MATSLEDALVEFFKRTTVSSAIVRRLAAVDGPRPHEELVREVTGMMMHLIPDYKFAASAGGVAETMASFEPTVETGLGLLVDAGIVTETDSSLTLSEAGRKLHDRITGPPEGD